MRILDNIADALQAVPGAAFGLMVDGRIDGTPVVDEAYGDKMGHPSAISRGQVANTMRLDQGSEVILAAMTVICSICPLSLRERVLS